MGELRWLDRIDPAKWSDAVGILEAERPLTESAVAKFLPQFGRSSEEWVADWIGDLSADSSDADRFLVALLEHAATEETWDLDKSFRTYRSIMKLLPELVPLRRIIDFEGLDVELPRWRHDETHFFGCLTPAAYEPCLEVVNRFKTSDAIAKALRKIAPSRHGVAFLSQVFARGEPEVELSSELETPYMRLHWKRLRQALRVTASKGHYLGLGMSV